MRLHFLIVKKILFFCLLIHIAQIEKLTAQPTYQLPPNQPEQDACNALQLCGGIFYTPYSYIGTGLKLDLDETPCLNQPGGGEKNSVWLQVRVASAGNIVFKITPVDPEDDYNFAVIKLPKEGCSSLTANDVVRCNYNSNIMHSNVNGVVGLSDTTRIAYVLNGTFGESFNLPVFASSGDVYLIMVNNLGNYSSGATGGGFTIDFTGSTSFYNVPEPQLSNADVPCNNANSITIKTTSNILCSSIAADGSDFTTDAPAKIISALGINCIGAQGYTHTIAINFSSVLPSGEYTIGPKKGNDGNMLTGFCNNELLQSKSIPFIVKLNAKAAVDEENICFQQLPYIWHGIKLNTGGDSVATYTTTSTAGCDSTVILNLHVLQAPQYESSSQTICDGDFYILPWDSTVTNAGTYMHHYVNINGCDSFIEIVTVKVFTPTGGNVQARDSTFQTGFCINGSVLLQPEVDFKSYLWNTSETSSTITVSVAGAYSLIAKDKYGCTTIDTFVVAGYPYPSPEFNTVENLCDGKTIVLDAGKSSTYYLWNDGSNTETHTVTEGGKYWVTLTTTRNCTITDTVTVISIPKPANFLMPSIEKCPFNKAMLAPMKDFAKYSWNTGSNENTINVSTGGFYSLTVTDDYGCTGKDSINVIDSLCPEYFYLPDAFTPNDDHRNDVFRPIFGGAIAGYQLSIYDKWGKLIFNSKDPSAGWDGTLRGYYEPFGIYVWICNYSIDGHPLHHEKGIVTLIR